MDLHRACDKRLRVKLEYLSAYKGELTIRTVDPHRLLSSQNAWYLVAYCNLRQDLRLFALHRIQHHDLTEETFEPVDKDKLESWLASPLFIEHQEQEIDVSIKFEPRAARYIREKIWHPSQQVTDHADGACTLSFKAPGIDEVKRWVLTYGGDAEVLAPPPLRSAVASELSRAVGKYSNASC